MLAVTYEQRGGVGFWKVRFEFLSPRETDVFILAAAIRVPPTNDRYGCGRQLRFIRKWIFPSSTEKKKISHLFLGCFERIQSSPPPKKNLCAFCILGTYFQLLNHVLNVLRDGHYYYYTLILLKQFHRLYCFYHKVSVALLFGHL